MTAAPESGPRGGGNEVQGNADRFHRDPHVVAAGALYCRIRQDAAVSTFGRLLSDRQSAGIAVLASKPERLALLKQPAKVWVIGIAGLFGYHFLYFTALRNAPAVEAGLIAYLWPLFIVVARRCCRARGSAGTMSQAPLQGSSERS